VGTDRSLHFSRQCKLSTCSEPFHLQPKYNCLLHQEYYSWQKHTDFLFNRKKSLFVINNYSTAYVNTDRSSHLSRKCKLSMCSQPFHLQPEYSCLLHPEYYSWPKHTDFLFNRKKSLFVINDYSIAYVGTDRSLCLSRKCNGCTRSLLFHHPTEYSCLLHREYYSWPKHTDFLFNRKKSLFVINGYSITYLDTSRSSHLSRNCKLSMCSEPFHLQPEYSCLLRPEYYSWPKHTDFLFNRKKPLFVIYDYFITYVDTDRSSHLSRKCKLSMCSEPFHLQPEYSCLLHPQYYSWPKHTDFLFNRKKSLFVINDYSITYVDTDRSSHLSRKCKLSTCSQLFHHPTQYSCLLHQEYYSWQKHTDFLFNRKKSLFVINDYFTTYVDTDRSSHLRRKCKLSTCSEPFHLQPKYSCLLHPEYYSWPKHTDFLFNRKKHICHEWLVDSSRNRLT
jgi:hypothetical protein